MAPAATLNTTASTSPEGERSVLDNGAAREPQQERVCFSGASHGASTTGSTDMTGATTSAGVSRSSSAGRLSSGGSPAVSAAISIMSNNASTLHLIPLSCVATNPLPPPLHHEEPSQLFEDDNGGPHSDYKAKAKALRAREFQLERSLRALSKYSTTQGGARAQ